MPYHGAPCVSLWVSGDRVSRAWFWRPVRDELLFDFPTASEVRDGEPPSPTRETRALPGSLRSLNRASLQAGSSQSVALPARYFRRARNGGASTPSSSRRYAIAIDGQDGLVVLPVDSTGNRQSGSGHVE